MIDQNISILLPASVTRRIEIHEEPAVEAKRIGFSCKTDADLVK
jgi:hypothetical protein